MVALAVVELYSPRFLRKSPRSVSPTLRGNGILLNAGTVIICNGKIGLNLDGLTLGIVAVISVNAYGGKVGYLIELAVVALTLIAIEL
jgi:hypothetical protein